MNKIAANISSSPKKNPNKQNKRESSPEMELIEKKNYMFCSTLKFIYRFKICFYTPQFTYEGNLNYTVKQFTEKGKKQPV